MFKSLLRTLPSLSGNFTIACKLNEIKKDDSENYHTYVRVADMLPLQNNIYKNSIELNLLNGKYEHDIKKYYLKYSNYFYKENFTYSNDNYKILNLNSTYNENNDDRNKDYEFGCKRIYYSRTGYQFSFYAPIYIDDINDLPDYFCISIKIGNVVKNIKIYLNKKYKTNYLKRYLESYLSNVDNRVIFCLPDSAQATYFGVDVKTGGFVQYKDNVFGYLYSNQIMINNFDRLICQGFERNNLIMRQIIPLSFMFNLNDIFSEYERVFFMGYQMNVLGYYYKNNIKLDFFDFDIDYFKSYNKYKRYNGSIAKYEYVNGYDTNGIINTMNVGYPALNESKYIKYEFENKITPNYCKFKMMLSSDDDPYITNTNYAYSYLQYPNQKYGYFPTTFKGITPKLVCIDGDVKLPTGNNINAYYKTSLYSANKVIVDAINYSKFLKLMQNYCSSWFNIYNEETLDELCNNNKLWSNIMYDYTYFKGILYDLKSLNKFNIDKFGIFLNFNFEKIKKDNIVKAKYIYSSSEKSNIKVYKFNNNYKMDSYNTLLNITVLNNFFINSVITQNNNYYLHYDKLLEKDFHGKYIQEKNYKTENTYFYLSDVLKIVNGTDFPKIVKQKITEYLDSEKTIGYLLLDGYNNLNYFEKYYDVYGNEQKQFMLSSSLFGTHNKNIKYKWLYDKLYYSTNISSQKNRLSDDYDKLDYNEDLEGKFLVYLENDFISLYNIYLIINEIYTNEDYKKLISANSLNNSYKSLFINIISNILNCTKYIFNAYGQINNIEVQHYFTKLVNENDKNIYVDSYNLNNLIKLYNAENRKKISLVGSITKEYYIKLINKDHIKEYYYKLNNDEDNKSTLESSTGKNVHKNILECLYVKERCWIIDNDVIDVKDTYTTLYNYLLNYSGSEVSANIDEIYSIMHYNNDNMFSYVYDHLSDVRNSNNKFELTIGTLKIEVDLAIKKKVYQLNNTLFGLLYNKNKINNYLYLYIESDCKNENNDTWPIYGSSRISNYNNKLKTKYTGTEFESIDKHIYTKNINEYLTPLFTNIYVTDGNKETIYNMIQSQKISNCKYMLNNEFYYKEIDIFETLYDIYCDKTNLVDDLYFYNFGKYKNSIDEKLKELIIYKRDELYNLLINSFTNIETSVMTYKQLVSYLTSEEEYDESVMNNLIKAIKEIIQNKRKSNELTNFLVSKSINDIFNNEYILDNNIDLNSLSINEYVNTLLVFMKEYDIDLLYELIQKNNITLYTIKDRPSVILNNFDTDKAFYDEESKLYIYKNNDITYGFYYLDLSIDNSNYSFYILNDYNLNIVFDTINGFDLYDKTFMNSIFYILYPFLNINVFELFAKQIPTILFQNEIEILIKYKENNYLTLDDKYKYINYIDSLDDMLYSSLIEYDQTKKLKLLRYFNFITPYLKRIDNIIDNCWTLRFMDYDQKYNNVKKNNILSVSDLNIYKYNDLNVYYGQYIKESNDSSKKYEFTDSYNVKQFEYKHFNDNLLYNLPEELILYDEYEYDLESIKKFENDNDLLYNSKINILYKYFVENELDYQNIKLFLFNKYDSSYFIETEDKQKYKIKYIFKLI